MLVLLLSPLRATCSDRNKFHLFTINCLSSGCTHLSIFIQCKRVVLTTPTSVFRYDEVNYCHSVYLPCRITGRPPGAPAAWLQRLPQPGTWRTESRTPRTPARQILRTARSQPTCLLRICTEGKLYGDAVLETFL